MQRSVEHVAGADEHQTSGNQQERGPDQGGDEDEARHGRSGEDPPLAPLVGVRLRGDHGLGIPRVEHEHWWLPQPTGSARPDQRRDLRCSADWQAFRL